MVLLLACVEPTDSAKLADSAAGGPVDTAPPADTADTALDTADTGDSADTTDTGEPLSADYLFHGTGTPEPLLGFGAEIWPGDTAWPAALDPLGARLVRISLNANLGSATLPVGQTPEQWDAWLGAYGLDLAPSFLVDLQTAWALTEARDIDWIAHPWEAPPAWENGGGVILPERVADYAALTAAHMTWLSDNGIEPRWLELSNEPDGTWNTYLRPEDYDALVIAVRADLDARGLVDIGIVGPGLAVLGGWDAPAEYVPALSDEAVAALDAWSVHTWDDYAEAGEGHPFLEARWDIFTGQTEARDPAKPMLVTEMGSKDPSFDGANYALPDPGVCGYSTESHGYAIRMLAHAAVALSAGADGIAWWEAVDPTWACSRYGMLDTAGRAKPFHAALSSALGDLPASAGTELPEAADLPAVALLGESRGVVLVVNDTADRLSRTVAITGGWQLDAASGFGVEERVFFDELVDFAQLSSVDSGVGIDGTNASYVGYDGGRAYRSWEGDASLTWTPGGELVEASYTSWSWTGAAAVPVRVELSADGASWSEAPTAEVVTTADWNRHDGVVTVASGMRQLRVVLPAEGAPPWNPQLGSVSLRWRLDTPAVLPEGDAPWTLDLPPASAVMLAVSR